MPVTGRLRQMAGDERGTTLTELLVGLFAGLVVLASLVTLIMVTLNTTTRVSARVHATQEARVTLTKVINQLHSACIAPKVAPLKGPSTGTELRFVHATGSAVNPTPTETRISHENGQLVQRDYAWISGVAPNWNFNTTTPVREVILNDGISPIGSKPIFTYYRSTGGTPSPLTTPVKDGALNEAVQVTVAFMATPYNDNGEAATPARIQGSATFRLTAVTYSTSAPGSPCQ